MVPAQPAIAVAQIGQRQAGLGLFVNRLNIILSHGEMLEAQSNRLAHSPGSARTDPAPGGKRPCSAFRCEVAGGFKAGVCDTVEV